MKSAEQLAKSDYHLNFVRDDGSQTRARRHLEDGRLQDQLHPSCSCSATRSLKNHSTCIRYELAHSRCTPKAFLARSLLHSNSRFASGSC